MEVKYIGAVMILAGCSAGGFYLAGSHRMAEACLGELIRALDFMCFELNFRVLPLPDLISSAGKAIRGPVSKLLHTFSVELSRQVWEAPDACMTQVLSQWPELPSDTILSLQHLGKTLGNFDLEGQIQGLRRVREHCAYTLDTLRKGREQRLRSYQTLGVCAGAALAIILL